MPIYYYTHIHRHKHTQYVLDHVLINSTNYNNYCTLVIALYIIWPSTSKVRLKFHL